MDAITASLANAVNYLVTTTIVSLLGDKSMNGIERDDHRLLVMKSRVVASSGGDYPKSSYFFKGSHASAPQKSPPPRNLRHRTKLCNLRPKRKFLSRLPKILQDQSRRVN